MTARSVMILGAGGHARVVLDALCAISVTPTACLSPEPPSKTWPQSVQWLGGDLTLSRLSPSDWVLVNGIGSTSDTALRARAFQNAKSLGFSFLELIDPQSRTAADVIMSEGVVILTGAIVQPGVQLGANVLINTRAILGHDTCVGDHTHIAPGAVVSGGVAIGDGAHIGAGAILKEGISIGAKAIVGAGAVVIDDIPAGACHVGNPARPISVSKT